MLVYITEINNNLIWISLHLDEDGKIHSFGRANYTDGEGLPTIWEPIPTTEWPIGIPMFDVKDEVQCQLMLDQNGTVHRVSLRQLRKHVIPLHAEHMLDGEWVEIARNNPFMDTLNNLKNSQLQLCAFTPAQKDTFVNIYENAQPKTWEYEKRKEPKITYNRQSKLSGLQQQTVNPIILSALSVLKEQSRSEDEYIDALSGVIRGNLDEDAHQRLGDVTFANALALRSQCYSATINLNIHPAPFYAELDNDAAQSITIADIREYLFSVLCAEWRSYSKADTEIELPNRVSAEEVRLGSVPAVRELNHYFGLSPLGQYIFALLYRAIHGELSGWVENFGDIDEFINGGENGRYAADQREVMDDLIAELGGDEFESAMAYLRQEVADLRVIEALFSDDEMMMPSVRVLANQKLRCVYCFAYVMELADSEEKIKKLKLIAPLIRDGHFLAALMSSLGHDECNVLLSVISLNDFVKNAAFLAAMLYGVQHCQDLVLMHASLGEIISSVDNLVFVLDRTEISLRKFVINNVSLSEIVNSVEDLATLLGHMKEDEVELITSKINLHDIIKDAYDFAHFIAIVDRSNFNHLINFIVKLAPHFIVNVAGLRAVLLSQPSLNLDERLFSVLPLRNIMTCADDFNNILAVASLGGSEQCFINRLTTCFARDFDKKSPSPFPLLLQRYTVCKNETGALLSNLRNNVRNLFSDYELENSVAVNKYEDFMRKINNDPLHISRHLCELYFAVKPMNLDDSLSYRICYAMKLVNRCEKARRYSMSMFSMIISPLNQNENANNAGFNLQN